MEITFDRASVGTSLQQRFVLPTYQRDYKWETKHLQELLTDIQEAFLEEYKPDHGRQDVGGYAPYFLGTIITTNATSGYKAIVDGQQRLTTLVTVMAYFSRFGAMNPNVKISNIEPMLRRQVYGQEKFNIEFDEDRTALFSNILDVGKNSDGQTLENSVESIQNISESSKRIFRLFNEIENFLLDEIKENLIPNFVDYLTERVYLFEIGVPSEQDGHKVFVTMNDRGLRLAPIDLLKGHFLSNISNSDFNTRANEKWTHCIRDLRRIGADEDSAFFKTWLRAQYASTIRGKNRGDTPGDFELVGESYHRWVVDKGSLLGLSNSDNFYNFVDGRLPVFVEHYKKIKDAEANYRPEFPSVYFNGSKDLTLQYMVILASIDINDSSADVEKKIKIVSYYMDYYSSMRIINGKDNNYDNIRAYVFSLSKIIRRKSVDDLINLLSHEMSNSEDKIDGIEGLTYKNTKKQDLLHLLARFADYLEEKIEQTNRVGFSMYVDRNKGSRTFDIEHVLPNKPSEVQEDLGSNYDFSARDFQTERDRLGGLILLPRSRNRSMKDMLYNDKIARYSGDNILAQTLSESFYQNNPQVSAFMKSENVDLKHIEIFNKKSIEDRTSLYKTIAHKIWNVSTMKAMA